MASFLHTDLPSDDEEDDNYDPTTDKTAEPEDRLNRPKRKAAGGPARRGLAAATAPATTVSAGASAAPTPVVNVKRREKAAAAFEALKAKVASNGRATPRPVSSLSALAAAPAAASLKRKATDPDLVRISETCFQQDADLWMRSLGLAPPAKQSRPTQDLVAAVLAGSTTLGHKIGLVAPPAATPAPAPLLAPSSMHEAAPASALDNAEAAAEEAPEEGPGASGAPALDMAAITAKALASASEAMGVDAARRAGLVTIKEKRRFAGQDVEIARELKAGSKEAEAAAAKAAQGDTGLDAVLSQITGPRKANVMDKTRDDWKGFKHTNKDVNEELEAYKKSGDKYLEKKAFLQKAELTEYEKERDARLGSDIRLRGRL